MNVSNPTLRPGSVTSTYLADGAVTTPKLADLAVTTGKVNDSAVTGGKIAASTVTDGNIVQTNHVTSLDVDVAIPANTLTEIASVIAGELVGNYTAVATFTVGVTGGTGALFRLELQDVNGDVLKSGTFSLPASGNITVQLTANVTVTDNSLIRVYGFCGVAVTAKAATSTASSDITTFWP